MLTLNVPCACLAIFQAYFASFYVNQYMVHVLCHDLVRLTFQECEKGHAHLRFMRRRKHLLIIFTYIRIIYGRNNDVNMKPKHFEHYSQSKVVIDFWFENKLSKKEVSSAVVNN